jgi:hypothetical protein
MGAGIGNIPGRKAGCHGEQQPCCQAVEVSPVIYDLRVI